jgi:hypothetical protein
MGEITVDLRCMYWQNGEYLIDSHKKVTEHLGLKVQYDLTTIPHGQWMNEVLENSTADVVGFFDNDCVPLNAGIVEYAIAYATATKSFIGTAQASNHIAPRAHIFAAPCFFFIYRDTWVKMGKPSFLENTRSDVAEEVSYVAEDHMVPYKALYPTHFEREPIEGVWRLGNFGYYGIGTVFANSVFHLFQGRYKQNADLFKLRCEEIVNGTFSTDGMFNSIEVYSGKICNYN